MPSRLHRNRVNHRARIGRAVKLRNLCELLEQRRLLTTTLYIDYGDRFPGGTLATTVGAIDSTTAAGNPNIDGPVLIDANGFGFAAATAVNIAGVNSLYGASAPALRATMTALAKRFYAPLDITVVELTDTFQNVNGFNVRGAATLTEASQLLGLNEATTENNDAYILVGRYQIGPTNFNPAFGQYGGLSTGTDIGTTNNNDGTALVCLLGGGDSGIFNGNQIAHEAGHTFGLRHVYRQGTVASISGTTATVAQYDSLHQSEIMSYLGYESLGGLSFFTKYPQMRGDGNTNANTLSSTPSPFEQMQNDVNIGPNPSLNYVTGTGENDQITITKTGANVAAVSISAFDDAAFTIPVDAPGATGNSYTYTISLDKPLLVEAGGRDDRVTLDADLGVTVTVRGMHGTDALYINGKNVPSATYTQSTSTANGIDGLPNRKGTITSGSTVVNFEEFETGSLVRVINVGALTMTTPAAGDSLTYGASGTESNISGSSGGLTLIPLRFTGVTTFTLDAATNASAGAMDSIALNVPATPSLTGVNVNTGDGNDSITMNASGTAAAVTVSGGAGNDTLTLSNAGGANPVFLAGGGTTNTINLGSGTWTVNADLGAGGALVTMNASGGNVVFGSTQHLASLAIGSTRTGTVTANGNRVLVTDALTLVGTGKLDLNDNDLVVKSTSASTFATVEGYVRTAYNFGGWNGTSGIFSTTAKNNPTPNTTLGTLRGSEYIPVSGSTFDGETILTNYVLIKYTYFGDVDFNGQVDGSDYNTIDFGFLSGRTGWANGDVNYSSQIDGTDYNSIDFAFLTQFGVL